MLHSGWIYFIEFGILQLLIGFFYGSKPGEGRNGAFLALLFSGPITFLSVWLDDSVRIFENVLTFGILFSIIALILLIYFVGKN